MQAHPTLYRIHYHGGQSSKGNPLYSFERLDPASADGDAVHATPPAGTMPAMLALPAPPVHATPTPAPAHGGGGVDAWTVDDVAAYLQRLELGHKVDLVRDIGLDGTVATTCQICTSTNNIQIQLMAQAPLICQDYRVCHMCQPMAAAMLVLDCQKCQM